MKREGLLLDFDKDLTFGVELEYINASRNTIMQYLNKVSPISTQKYERWGYSPDYAFTESRDNDEFGGEVKSAILRNDDKSLKDLNYVLRKMKKAKASVDYRTGLHYHVSADVFKNKKKNLIKFLKLYLAYEHVIYKFGYNGSIPRKAMFDYAMPIRTRLLQFISQLEEAKDYKQVVNILQRNFNIQKTMGLNLGYILMPINTVEFRMCNGSLDYDVILNEIELFCNLMLSCERELDEELIKHKIAKFRENSGSLLDYAQVNMEDAKEFSNIIYLHDESKDRFMEQYKKVS